MAIRKLSKTSKRDTFVPMANAPKGPPRGSTIWLLQEIKAHRVDPRTLTPGQRRSCLTLMVPGKLTAPELAELFKVAPSTIRQDLTAIRDELGREVREYTPEQVVGQLAMVADRCTADAFSVGDTGLAWAIQRDLAKLLKEFGFLGGTEQGGVRITIEAMGEGYGRASSALAQALDPRLTGEVIDVENEAQEVDRAMEGDKAQDPPPPPVGARPRLPFSRTVGAPGGPRAEVVTASPDVDNEDE